MRVLGAGVDLELAEHLPPERAFGEHALNRKANDFLGLLGQHVAVGLGPDATGVARVPVIELLSPLVGRQHHLCRIDDYYVVASVDVGGEHDLVLATQDARDLGRQSAKYGTSSIDLMPLAADLGSFGRVGTHGPTSLEGPQRNGQPGRSR